MSLLKMENNGGPSSEPCGTLCWILDQLDATLSTTTCCILLEREFLNHVRAVSLCNSMELCLKDMIGDRVNKDSSYYLSLVYFSPPVIYIM